MERLVRLHDDTDLLEDESVCVLFTEMQQCEQMHNGCERRCPLQVCHQIKTAKCCKPGWVFASFPPSNCDCLKWIHLKFASEYQSERSKPQSNKGWGLKIDSFFFFYTTPPSQFNFTLLSCAFIWRLHNAVLRRVSLCQAVQGCKGSSSRGMKWAQTSASKWFLSLGQTPPPPPFP